MSFPPDLRRLALLSVEQVTIAFRRQVPILAQVEAVNRRVRELREPMERLSRAYRPSVDAIGLGATIQACGPPMHLSVEQPTAALRTSMPMLAQVEAVDRRLREMREPLERQLRAVQQIVDATGLSALSNMWASPSDVSAYLSGSCGPPVDLPSFARRANDDDRLVAAVRTVLADFVDEVSSSEAQRTPGLDEAIEARWAQRGDPARKGGEGWNSFCREVCAAAKSRVTDRTIQRRVQALKLRGTTKT